MEDIPVEVKPVYRSDNQAEVYMMESVLQQILLVRGGNHERGQIISFAINRERMGEFSESERELDSVMIKLRFFPVPSYTLRLCAAQTNTSSFINEHNTRCYVAGADIKIHNVYHEDNAVYAEVTILNYLEAKQTTPVPFEQLCGEATPNKELCDEGPEKCTFVSEEAIDGLRASDTKLFELKTQVGGDHYAKCAIQPIDYIMANRLDYLQGNVIKYVTRYKNKNGVEDLEKAAHYLRIMIEREKAKDASNT